MIYDISMMIHQDMQVYKNKAEKKPSFKTLENHQDNHVHETEIKMGLHTGTHVDYPLHMIQDGKTSDNESLLELIGTCKVLDLTEVDVIDEEILSRYNIDEDDFILFKTKNSLSDDFIFDFVYLTADGAEYLKKKKIRGVGTDALGIERSQPDHPTHKLLLEDDIIIIEGLRLKDIKE
ncbi:MAG TPA: cyclase family protein, partial [Candidatus Izemoplasmatales bacterium]|nr:cyclase family protein [Candidatus Izemoplasmatales bacterium]